MTKVAEVMTDRPRAIAPETSIRDAARMMEEEDIGSLPVVKDGARLVAIVTDRDIAIRAVGRGLEPEGTPVMDIASKEVYVLTPDDDLDDALEMMARAQVRRLPVVVRENELVGMVAQADVARTTKEKKTGEVVQAISKAPSGLASWARMTAARRPVPRGRATVHEPSAPDQGRSFEPLESPASKLVRLREGSSKASEHVEGERKHVVLRQDVRRLAAQDITDAAAREAKSPDLQRWFRPEDLRRNGLGQKLEMLQRNGIGLGGGHA
jgi:CBS domain-containing protein